MHFNQEPHAVHAPKEKNLEVAIGREVREIRKRLGITVSELATSTGLSVGMLSKIENGVTSPSLGTLQLLSKCLAVPLTTFFRRVDETRSAVFVRAGHGIEVERRGARAGHQYRLLGHIQSNNSGVMVEPYLINITKKSDVFPTFQHDGLEIIYMLEGELIYRHADKLYRLLPGDSLFFEADAPHGPEQYIKYPVRFISVISYPHGNSSEQKSS